MTKLQQLHHLRFTVTGKVQGVFFRANAVSEAKKLNIGGWIENQPDGSVKGEAVGIASNVESFKTWLQSGPVHATVQDLQTTVEEVEEDGYGGVFEKRKNKRV